MGFFDAIIGGITDLITTNSANHESRNQMYNQMAWQEKMWNMQNEYNDPRAQMARLSKAGINPIMQGGISNMPAQSVGSVGTPQVQKSKIGDYIAEAVQSQLSAYRDRKQGKLLDAQTTAQMIDNQTKGLKNIAEIDNLIADTRNKIEEARKTGKETDLLEKDLQTYDDWKQETIRSLRVGSDLNENRIEYNKRMVNIELQKIAVQREQIANTKWIAKLNNDIEARRVAIEEYLKEPRYQSYFKDMNVKDWQMNLLYQQAWNVYYDTLIKVEEKGSASAKAFMDELEKCFMNGQKLPNGQSDLNYGIKKYGNAIITAGLAFFGLAMTKGKIVKASKAKAVGPAKSNATTGNVDEIGGYWY